ncbi:MAG TPA: aldo/keto reductase [Thermodesulfovibrionales bacterium]|nr:aldo/keto reductase [Thermodesulfovibrionales bacterium]
MSLQKRTLGKTGVEVTILGLGGEGVLRTFGREDEAYRLINRALDLGINYFESARAYAGSEAYYGLALRERRNDIFLTSKSHARDRQGALDHLTETLRNMKTDHIDLWQVHDVRTDEDIEEIFGTNGAIEAFAFAKEKGMTRFIGVTGHHDPIVLSKCIGLFDFDTVLMPVNPAEPSYKSFIGNVLPVARERRMGVIGMKVYFRGLAARLGQIAPLSQFYRFALSHDIDTAVIGCDTPTHVEENVMFAGTFLPLDPQEKEFLESSLRSYARRLMYYKE